MPNSKRTRPTRNGRAIRANQATPATPPPVGAFVPARIDADAPAGATAHPSSTSSSPDPAVTFAAPVPTTGPVAPTPGSVAAGASTPPGPGAQEPPTDPPPAPAPGDPPTDPPADPPASSVHISDVLAALGMRSPSVRVVREPSPYDPQTDDGRARSFFIDVRAAALGDPDARTRVRAFEAQLGAYIEAANQDQAGSGEVIPPAWGGQWYVEELAWLRPLVSSFTGATITDARPIPIPRYKDTLPDVPGKLVTEHVEGAPPSSGTIEFDTVTVQPKGYSGKVPVTRELLDSSPQLVDQAVSMALRESYSQVTEEAFATVLEAGAAGGIDAADATPEALELAVRQTIAMFPSTRFALAGRAMLAAEHFEALAGANDATGRPLLPYVGYGPTNAPGTSAAAYGSMQIAGVESVASWASTATKSLVRASIDDAMSFESSTLEFRFAEKSGPELVEFAVWGYFAGIVRRNVGVRIINSAAAPLAAAAPAGNGGAGNGGAAKREAK